MLIAEFGFKPDFQKTGLKHRKPMQESNSTWASSFTKHLNFAAIEVLSQKKISAMLPTNSVPL